jgi:hypothetical protein
MAFCAQVTLLGLWPCQRYGVTTQSLLAEIVIKTSLTLATVKIAAVITDQAHSTRALRVSPPGFAHLLGLAPQSLPYCP